MAGGDNVDEYVGVKDVLKRDIYELDIVKYRIDSFIEEREGIVLWETLSQNFVLLDISTKHCTPIFIEDLCIFYHSKMEVVSHLFNHPKLIHKLGLKLE